MNKIQLSLFFTLNFINTSFSQDFYFENQWESIGPNNTPGYFNKMSSLGIGPTEFIKSTPLQEGLLLTGSINGGLFFSTDRGNVWQNAGSDNWDYSTVSYADFYPKNPNIWFGVSCYEDKKSTPSPLNLKGGIYRTTDQGSSWKKIGDKKSLKLTPWTTIYSFKYNPQSPSKMYLLTSLGLVYTEDCLKEKVEWKKETQIKGLMYDMTFVGNIGFITNKSNNEWHIYKLENNKYSIINSFETLNKNISHVTINTFGNQLLILVDYSKGADKLLLYNKENDTITELSRSQRVLFGHGFTFGVNPANINEIYVGSGTRLRRWNYETKKFENLSSDYHVDVEFVNFDPFDENIIYMCNHGGISVSYDKGKSWETKNNGLSIASVLGMAVSKSDPNQIVIGTYHDGSIVYADWEKNGTYSWKNVNGGDALIPLIDPSNNAIIYTSNQYNGGGLYVSNDTTKTNTNLHRFNGLKTPGWEMAATLHPLLHNVLYFNFKRVKGESTGNYDVVRTFDVFKKNSVDTISNFKQTHDIQKYKVYGLFNSKYHPNILLAYVLHFDKNEKGKFITKHRVFRTLNALDSAKNIINSWVEIEVPRNFWIGDIEMDRKNYNKLYFSYTSGRTPPKDVLDETGMIYYAKYRKKNSAISRNIDVSLNIPQDLGGRYNLIFVHNKGKKRFAIVGTRSGVYFGTKFNLKGSGNWKKIGYGLPHCKIYSIHYDEKNMLITVGLKGRGVWRISLRNDKE
jgi:hypothetical protein